MQPNVQSEKRVDATNPPFEAQVVEAYKKSFPVLKNIAGKHKFTTKELIDVFLVADKDGLRELQNEVVSAMISLFKNDKTDSDRPAKWVTYVYSHTASSGSSDSRLRRLFINAVLKVDGIDSIRPDGQNPIPLAAMFDMISLLARKPAISESTLWKALWEGNDGDCAYHNHSDQSSCLVAMSKTELLPVKAGLGREEEKSF